MLIPRAVYFVCPCRFCVIHLQLSLCSWDCTVGSIAGPHWAASQTRGLLMIVPVLPSGQIMRGGSISTAAKNSWGAAWAEVKTDATSSSQMWPTHALTEDCWNSYVSHDRRSLEVHGDYQKWAKQIHISANISCQTAQVTSHTNTHIHTYAHRQTHTLAPTPTPTLTLRMNAHRSPVGKHLSHIFWMKVTGNVTRFS